MGRPLDALQIGQLSSRKQFFLPIWLCLMEIYSSPPPIYFVKQSQACPCRLTSALIYPPDRVIASSVCPDFTPGSKNIAFTSISILQFATLSPVGMLSKKLLEGGPSCWWLSSPHHLQDVINIALLKIAAPSLGIWRGRNERLTHNDASCSFYSRNQVVRWSRDEEKERNDKVITVSPPQNSLQSILIWF